MQLPEWERGRYQGTILIQCPCLKGNLSKIKVGESAWDRANGGSIRAAMMPGREACQAEKVTQP
eukprot:50344-Pelagomonas_calceolata.AAC.1